MRRLAALLTALLFAGSALAGGSWYRGFIGEEPWQLELNIEGELVRGRLTHDELPLQLEGAGNLLEEDGALVARFGLEGGKLTGTLLSGSGTTQVLEGSFLSDDGISDVRFEQVARYVDHSFRQDRIEATSTYPFFVSPRLLDLNDFVQPDLMAEQIQFVQEAQQADLDGYVTHEWWFDSRARIEYVTPGLLSALVTVNDYTGGAHSNLSYWSYNLALVGTQLRPFVLADLFLPDSGWADRLSRFVLTELEEQGAGFVTNGTVTELSATDLQVFLLSPSGLQFILAPYQVGPWSDGTYTVTVPLAELRGLLDPEGPVRNLPEHGF